VKSLTGFAFVWVVAISDPFDCWPLLLLAKLAKN